MKTDTKNRIATRLRRVAGQVAGVQRMLDEDRYCVDVLNQIAAIRSALDAAGVELIAAHLESCVLGRDAGHAHDRAKPMSHDELLAEVREIIKRFLK